LQKFSTSFNSFCSQDGREQAGFFVKRSCFAVVNKTNLMIFKKACCRCRFDVLPRGGTFYEIAWSDWEKEACLSIIFNIKNAQTRAQNACILYIGMIV